ncbi:MAG: hypothetical protein NTW65_03840 [Deltaproteobacteria bacterium]|nr:hypothetical protein [Deltaproteobacteria bacterium]
MKIKLILSAIILGIGIFGSNFAISSNYPPNFIGEHILTLQWLQNLSGVGKAKISEVDGKLVIDGYQEESCEAFRASPPCEGGVNYMKIKGNLRIISSAELEFEGVITTKINYINNGKIYERKGKFIMKAWGTRKYWRMQKMTEPDEDRTVADYIDLYFK